ncbi:MAG TPA: hypothetical protein VFI73_00535 [Candidatus Nitrosopolaris sp.]|nr:hypothetical protein [Candidatus Nitrosopolaris sp.]
MQRGYIILITGAAFLITGISVSAIQTNSLVGIITHQNTILNVVSIKPFGTVNAITQISDINHPLSLVIHVESNGNPSLREIVRDPDGQVISANEFSHQFLTRLKTDVVGKYILTVDNLGNNPVSVGVLFDNLPFLGQNNQFNVNLFGVIVVEGILIIFAIIILITGLIIVILDRRRDATKPTATT